LKDAKQVLTALIEAHNRHDLEGMLDYIADDIVTIDPVAPIPLKNKHDVRTLYHLIFNSLRDIHFETLFILGEGNQAFVGVRTTGTGSGVWGGKDISGRPFDVYEGIYVRVADGKVNYFMGFSDSAQLTKQLGGYEPALGKERPLGKAR
jgi:ketosteroid isomerase-like protein